jgi:hypothetical protein
MLHSFYVYCGIVTSWILLFALFCGVGLLVRRIFKLQLIQQHDLMLSFWSGWVLVIGLLQIWHIWWKVDLWAVLIFVVFGGIGLILYAGELLRLLNRVIRQNTILVIIVVGLAFWCANLAIGPMSFDTQLYQFPMVNWMKTYPVIPGLGNVHGRFAFNNSQLLYASLLDQGPWEQLSNHIAAGLILWVLLLQSVANIVRLLRLDGNNWLYHVLWGMMLAPIVSWILGQEISSLSTDVGVFALGIVLSLEGYYWITQSNLSNNEHLYRWVVLMCVALAGITIKLSFIVLAIVSLVVLIGFWLYKQRDQLIHAIKTILIIGGVTVLFFIGPWMIRGVLLSGYLFYPLTWLSIPVSWRIPRSLVISEAKWISSWARQPDAMWTDVLGNPHWLFPWLVRVPPGWKKGFFLMFLGVVVGLPLWWVRHRKGNEILLIVIIPNLCSLAFWFLTAPEFRFAGSTFYLLVAGFIGLLLINLTDIGGNVQVLGIVTVFVVFLSLVPLSGEIFRVPNGREVFYSQEQPDYQLEFTDSGLGIHVPKESPFCTFAELPCIISLRPELYLLEEGNIQGGFALQKDPVYVDFLLPATPDNILTPDGVGAIPWQREFSNIKWFSVTPDLKMRSQVEILIYVPLDTDLNVTLAPEMLSDGRCLVKNGNLIIKVNEIEIEDLNIQPDESYKIQLPMERDHNLLRLIFEPGDVVNVDECAIKDQDDLPHIIWKPISFSYQQPDSSSDREQ